MGFQLVHVREELKHDPGPAPRRCMLPSFRVCVPSSALHWHVCQRVLWCCATAEAAAPVLTGRGLMEGAGGTEGSHMRGGLTYHGCWVALCVVKTAKKGVPV